MHDLPSKVAYRRYYKNQKPEVLLPDDVTTLAMRGTATNAKKGSKTGQESQDH